MDTFLERDTMSELKFAQVPFNTPFVVMFSSGTTGAPKGIGHSHGVKTLSVIKFAELLLTIARVWW
jgi:acetoacetyl-CoA synthetase